MDNDLIEQKNWFKRNWKWFVPVTVLFIFVLGLFLTPNSQGNLTDVVYAYNNAALYEKAIEKSNSNKRVLQTIGTIQPIDKLAILEGSAVYSNDKNSVKLSLRIKGAKGNGKLDIVANKLETGWIYQKITVRTKESKEGIVVLNEY
jgi:hypothetical protein